MVEENLSQEEREKRVFNLTVEEEDVKRQKKSIVKGFNEEIKRIREEKKELLGDKLETAAVY